MLQNPMAGGRTPTQYAQSFGTPGTANIGMGGPQMGGQVPGQRGRQRAVSNINAAAPEGYQMQDTSISQWQSGVMASQGGSAQPQGERV